MRSQLQREECFWVESRESRGSAPPDPRLPDLPPLDPFSFFFYLSGSSRVLWSFGLSKRAEAKLISYGSTERIKALNRRLHWGTRGIVYDLRHVDVLVKDLRFEEGN